ncbi:MAG: hypothetical protein ACOC00_08105 [Halothiobacillaceae bacterium]
MIDSRRHFLRLLLAGLAAAQWPVQATGAAARSGSSATTTRGNWDQAAERLSGVDGLGHGPLHDVRAALLARHDPARIDKLAAVAMNATDDSLAADLENAGLQDLAQEALMMVFGVTRLADFDFSAMPVWTALGYTKPPSYCSPEFGDWAHPPKEASHG